MEQKRLFLLDAYALIFRAYYALAQSPRIASNGMNTSAIFGFVNTLQEVLTKEQPTHIAVCFDPPGPTFRHEAYEAYKAEREATPEDIKIAVPYIKEILQAYRIPVVEVPGYEADDVIGTLARQASVQGFTTYMMTPDKDYGQLVDGNTFIFKPGWRGGDFEVRGVKEVCAKYEIERPCQVIDILALMGDKVDNIPGCPGVGQVTAIKLIKQFGSVEGLLENTAALKGALKAKVEANAEQIKFSKFLATIKTDVPVQLDEEQLRRRSIDAAALKAVFEKLEFKTFITRILGKDATAAAQPAGKTQQAQPKPQAAQRSLFDDDGAVAAAESVVADYGVAGDVAAVAARVPVGGEIGLATVITGEEPMRSRLLGVAIAFGGGKAVYVPVKGGDTEAVAAMLRKVLGKCSVMVSGDVKRDMIMLRGIGVEVPSGKYFDTAVAHYLLQPEVANHSTARLAETLLGAEATPLESLTGPRGKNYRELSQLTPQELCGYACQQADYALRLRPLLQEKIEQMGMQRLLCDIELPLIEVLAAMEMAGVRIDVVALNEYSRELTQKMDALEAECMELAGVPFNTSSPAQVGEVIFGQLGLDPKAKKTRTGQYSTTEEVLAKLKDRHPIVGKILELRGIRKLLSTYVNALPQLINPATGRIHTTYNQTVTATGRLSSTNPNIQNIPVRNEEGREIRRAFIPASGNLFFSADYSQIELRLVADMSGDETMVNAFLAGEDIHALTAAKIYHEPMENVTPDQRRKAKTANFGILYGISSFGLSERLEIPRAEATMLIDGYFATFPGVRRYINESIAHAHEKGYVATLYGRRRALPDINSRNGNLRSFSERNAINAPIQGTAADIIKIAMIRIYRRFKEAGLQSKMIMQVHDELNFDVVPEEIDRVREIVKTEMENAYHGRVPLTASCGVADNWLDAH